MIANVETSRRPDSGLPWVIRGPIEFFSSVWVGIFWLALLFVYCSIGSAVPRIRQLPWLEMTEFEWFNWWPFEVLIALFCVSLVVVTVRRIPLTKINLGVWMIHAGIIILCVGSVIYFSMKEEGDAPVFRRHVRIELPGLENPLRLVALPGNTGFAQAADGTWKFDVDSTNPDWPILSDEHKGEKAYAVNVRVTPPNGEPFVRQLLDGYPQYTEDVLPGRGRAIKAVGKKLIDDSLALSLDFEPTEYFHLQDTWALFIRRPGETEWVERPIHGMGRYRDRIASREQVFTDPSESLTIRPIDLTVPAVAKDDPLPGVPLHVTGYLRHAEMRREWREGGDRLNPRIQLSVIAGGKQADTHELFAFDREHSQVENGALRLVWLDSPEMVSALPTDPRARLVITVPGSNDRADVVLTTANVGPDQPYTPIGASGFSYRVKAVQDELVLPNTNGTVSIAMVDFQGPDGEFSRMVADRAELTRDMRGTDADPHAAGRAPQAPDPRVDARYQPATAPVIIAAHSGGLHLVVNGADGRRVDRAIQVGQIAEITSGLALRVDELQTRAVSELKPYIVPLAMRQREARENYSMIRLEMPGVPSRWLRFNSHALPSEQYAYRGRMGYSPEQIRMPDGSWLEVMFSRERRKLPYPVGMDGFELETHIGGYSGSASSIFNYVSRLRFEKPDGRWTDARPIKVNAPTEYGGYWYFQSYWDRPSGGGATGMNFTGLGIGNRHGVHVQLAGSIIATIGMFYAFYFKPLLKRRRVEASRERAEDREDDVSLTVEGAVARQPVGV